MLAILTTHPIQYQVPLWRAMARDGRVPFEVWFMSDHGVRPSYDSEFGARFAWDIDMLSGYPHKFLKPAKAAPGSFWRFRLRESLRERIAQGNVTALLIQGWQVMAYWQAVREAKAAGVHMWLRGESNDLALVPAWKTPLKRLLLGYLFGKVDRFLTIGSANRRLYESYGIPASQLHPAPYAVDNARFARQAEALRPRRQALRQLRGIADCAFCVLFCGKFIAKKRPLDLIAAAQRLRAILPNIHLLFAGSGELEFSMRAACEAAGVPSSFTGFLNQTEISQAYVAADCLVLPSDHGETWGLVVNEALASGLPCVASDACGCTQDLLRPIDPRLSYRLGDVADLAQALLHVCHSPPAPAPIVDVLAKHSFSITVDMVATLMATTNAP